MDCDGNIPIGLYVAVACGTVGAWCGHKLIHVDQNPMPAIVFSCVGFVWGASAPLTAPLTACALGVFGALKIGEATYISLKEWKETEVSCPCGECVEQLRRKQ